MTSKNVDKSGDVENSADKSGPIRDPVTGRLSGGNPGNKGGGRPPNAWKAKMEALADRWAQAAEAEKVLDDPTHPNWMAAGKFAAEMAHGKPAQTIKGDPDHPLRFEVVRERKRRDRADD